MFFEHISGQRSTVRCFHVTSLVNADGIKHFFCILDTVFCWICSPMMKVMSSVKTGGVMAVSSQCNTPFFVENDRLYNLLQLKAIISHNCLQTRKQLPLEIH